MLSADSSCWYPDRPFSVVYGGKGPFRYLVGPRLGLHVLLNAVDMMCVLLESTDIVLSMIKILFLLKFEVLLEMLAGKYLLGSY